MRSADDQVPGRGQARAGTRWRRAAAMAGAALCATGGLGSMMWHNALGFNAAIVIQDGNATFSSTRITAQDAAFGMTAVKLRNQAAYKNVLRAGFASATMNGFCLSKTQSLAGLDYTVLITAGDGNPTTPSDVSAQNAALDITWLRTDGGNGIRLNGSTQIGLATTDLTTAPGAPPYTANPFGLPTTLDPNYYTGSTPNPSNGQGYTGIDATSAELDLVYGDIWQAQIEGNISLPNLHISVEPGRISCKERAMAGDFPS